MSDLKVRSYIITKLKVSSIRLTVILTIMSAALTFISVVTLYTVKILLFIGTNFRGFYKMHWSLGFLIRGFRHYMQQSMGKMYFVRF